MQILEKIEDSGRAERGPMDIPNTPFRKSREMFSMLQLRTVFPCGLNDRIGDEPKKEDNHVLVGKWFPPLARNHPRVTRGNCHQDLNVITTEYFFKLFCKNLGSDLPNVFNFSHIHLMSMNKSKLMKSADLLNENLNEHCFHE